MTFICLGFQSEFLENCIPCRECENAILPEAALIQFSSRKPNSDSFRAKFYFSLQLCRTGSFARLQSALLYETPPIRVVILVGRPYSESPSFKTPEVRSVFFSRFDYGPQTKLRKGIVFYTCLSVILFTGGGACVPHMPPRHAHPPAKHVPHHAHPHHTSPYHEDLPAMHAPRHTLPPAMQPPATHAPPPDTTRCSQWAGGTHPTGMHSCLYFNYFEENVKTK